MQAGGIIASRSNLIPPLGITVTITAVTTCETLGSGSAREIFEGASETFHQVRNKSGISNSRSRILQAQAQDQNQPASYHITRVIINCMQQVLKKGQQQQHSDLNNVHSPSDECQPLIFLCGKDRDYPTRCEHAATASPYTDLERAHTYWLCQTVSQFKLRSVRCLD